MPTLGEIEKLIKEYSDSYSKLFDKVRNMQDEIEQVKRKHLRFVKQFADEALERKSRLAAAVEQSPEIFVKPKTFVIHGMRVGFQKGKGKITIPDEEKTILLIRKHLPEQAEVLVKTEEHLIKDALNNLNAADLKKVGLNLVESTDKVLIKPVDSDIDKIVTALIKEDLKDDMELVKPVA